MMNSARFNMFFVALSITSFAYAGDGRNVNGKMAEQAEYPAHKLPKLASKAENGKDEKRNKIGLNQPPSNSTELTGQHTKKQLSKEERQALRSQINRVGGYYPNKANSTN
jgi:hypothetical protein